MWLCSGMKQLLAALFNGDMQQLQISLYVCRAVCNSCRQTNLQISDPIPAVVPPVGAVVSAVGAVANTHLPTRPAVVPAVGAVVSAVGAVVKTHLPTRPAVVSAIGDGELGRTELAHAGSAVGHPHRSLRSARTGRDGGVSEGTADQLLGTRGEGGAHTGKRPLKQFFLRTDRFRSVVALHWGRHKRYIQYTG